MSTLTNEEQNIADQIKGFEQSELAGEAVNMRALGFKNGQISEKGTEAVSNLNILTNVAYKVMKNSASKLSKTQEKLNDVSRRHGRDSKSYDVVLDEYNEVLATSKDDEHRYNLLKNTNKVVGQSTMNGLTF